MNDTDIRAAVLRALTRVAPELNPRTLKGDVRLRDQIDIDSMDFFNFMVGLHAELGVDVPEADYPEVATLDGCVAYLASRAADVQPQPAGDR